MKTYQVTLSDTYIVEADNEDEAWDIAVGCQNGEDDRGQYVGSDGDIQDIT